MPKNNFKKKLLLRGFSKLNFAERIEWLKEHGLVLTDDINVLTKESSLNQELINCFIENSIGCFPLPLGIAVNFLIDNHDYIIPMVIEENSVIAAASKTAKWIRQEGEITTKTLSHLAIGQIHIPKVKEAEKLSDVIEKHKQQLIDMANNEVAHSMVLRGGGVKEITVRSLARGDGFHMFVIHIMIDTCDAMGANMINQICEFLRIPIEDLLHEKVGMCILSNLTDQKITEATVTINNIDPLLGEAIQEASLFAQLDPYRAATNNKGILNAVDAVLLATGNDWRAVEAGMHAYAARSGNYSSLSEWKMHDNDLVGVLRAPISVGIVGGVTHLHPVAKIALSILDVQSAAELARVIAAVGLVQNLGALNALVTDGIIRGHMKLHLNNMAIAAGATNEEIPFLIEQLTQVLAKNKHITSKDVALAIINFRKS